VHHVAFWSDDLVGDTRRLASRGWELEVCMRDAAGEPSQFAYLIHPVEPRIELVDSARRDYYAAMVATEDPARRHPG